jgi:hypothetical protein
MKSSHSILVAGLAACSSTASLPEARFTNAEPVRAVNDQHDVPRPPADREFVGPLYHFDGSFTRPMRRALTLEAHRRARGVNAIDEVPDSTWFTNRVGVRDLSPEEIRNGPLTIENPSRHTPWTILDRKSTGEALGLLVRDARGERFLVKLDRKGFPELESAAAVVTNRLLWAAGYNVTEDFISFVRRSDLIIDPKATQTNGLGKKHAFRDADLDRMLRGAEIELDGRIRVMASRFAVGEVIGGHPDEGVRADDPNDRIPHELRRDLRGARAFFAWLDHVDVKEPNSLDVWVTEGGRHFVRHYFVDFGKSLGVMAAWAYDIRRGYEYRADYDEVLTSMVTLGQSDHAWLGRKDQHLRGVGLFDTESFAPARWKPDTPVYRPLLTADRYDWLWAAKIISRFTPVQLRAAVEAGELSDPLSREYLTEALQRRQRAIAHYAFSLVRPIDDVYVTGTQVCFDDLMIAQSLVTGPEATATRYQITAYDHEGHILSPTRVLGATPSGHLCTAPLKFASSRERYTVVRVQTNGSAADTYVHVARAPETDELRVIGLWRE